MHSDVLVIGAGAAGLMCAAEAGKRGLSVVLLEHNSEPGKKILISGGGRCNFTNASTSAGNFLSENPHFAKSALARYTPQDFIALVDKHRIAWHEKKLGQLFCDGSARQIVSMLLAECNAGRVRLVLNASITSVGKADVFAVETSAGRFEGTRLVIATGGLSIPKIGATPFGYRVAEQFGCKVIKPRPALVPITFAPAELEQYGELSGVSAEVVATAGAGRFREKMLFTHKGLSGPAILQASSYWSPGESIQLDLLPGVRFVDEIEERRRRGDRSSLKTMLSAYLPQRFADRWLALNNGNEQRLEGRLHSWEVKPAGTEGFAKAEVTRGGVDTSELSSKSMESRTVRGLFFIGEVVDVTGHLGGYN
ncbi:MAG TPA: NAD(P)/FAD-dependent oxidoreductase, partial [Bryobacteraceae bacterium]|nr:NAD(P)/FAD-dependent oxidoreductase [Bryobacteraceae bacterium]